MQNLCAVITGGSSGIGKALAKACVKNGWNVIIGSRQTHSLDKACADLASYAIAGQFVHSCRVDVADEKSIAQFADFCVHAAAQAAQTSQGTIDFLFNCAGISVCKKMEDIDSDEYRLVSDIDYLGTVLTVKYFVPHMQRGAHIVNISSMAGVMGVYGYTAYGAAKYAVTGFTEVLRCELLCRAIHVSLVLPPDTDTPQLANENLTKPDITKRIAGSIKPLSAEKTAYAILRGVKRKKFLIIPGFTSKLVYRLTRLFPNLLYAYSKLLMMYKNRENIA